VVDHRAAALGERAHRGELGAGVLERDRPADQPRRIDRAAGDRPQQRVVVADRHPVDAAQLQLVGDDAVHRQRDRPLAVDQQPDLDVAAALAQAADRAHTGRGAAERVERDVGAAAGRVDHRLDGIARARVDRLRRTELTGEGKGLGVHVDGDDGGAERRRDHHRRQAEAAAAVDCDPVAGCDAAVHVDGRERGHEPAAEARGLDEAELLGQPDEVQVGARQRDVLGERAPCGEARLEVLVADLRLAVPTRLAAPAAAAERHRHPVAGREAANLRPDRLDHPGQLVAGHVRQRDRRVMAHPAVPVAPADPGRPDRHHDPVTRGSRIRHRLHPQRLPELMDDGGSHLLDRSHHVDLRLRQAVTVNGDRV
jgi:hypothetical protein